MLAEALQAEVDAYIARFADERDGEGRRLVVRNGYHQPREVLTSVGAIEVRVPRVNDKRTDPATGAEAVLSGDRAAVGAQDPVELLRFFEKVTPAGPGAQLSPSLADFGDAEVAEAEAAIEEAVRSGLHARSGLG